MLISAYERVYTVDDYCDQPRKGVADFSGLPHYYDCVFDAEKDEWTNVYLLKALDDASFRLYLQGLESWLRWQSAYREGRASLASHPALRDGQEDSAEIAASPNQRPDAQESDLKAKGEFTPVEFASLGECIEAHDKADCSGLQDIPGTFELVDNDIFTARQGITEYDSAGRANISTPAVY